MAGLEGVARRLTTGRVSEIADGVGGGPLGPSGAATTDRPTSTHGSRGAVQRSAPGARAGSRADAKAESSKAASVAQTIHIVEHALGEPPSVGSHPADATRLADSPAGSYLHGAGISEGTFGELVDASAPTFARTPDPTPSLLATHAAHAARPASGATLRFTTYNVGLLDTPKIMRPIPRFFAWLYSLLTGKQIVPPSPHMDERRALLPDAIFGRGDDIVCLQELWTGEDVAFFSAAAQRHGYVAVATPRGGDGDDLVTFVKATAIDPRTPVEHRHKAFAASDWPVRLTTRVHQGFQIVSFQHVRLGRINVVNTHMPPLTDSWRLRIQDARELGLAAAAVSGGDSITLLGGDLNAAPHYGVADWRTGGAPSDTQKRNSLSYAVLRHYGGFDDLVVAGRPGEGAADDVRRASRVVDRRELPEFPFSCDPTNPLNVLQGGADDPLERADHLLGRGTRLKATRSEMIFTESLPGRDYPLSDHYGFSVELRVQPPRSPKPSPGQMSPAPGVSGATTRPQGR